ncbi:hypothetical protein D3C87_1559740 [compost metagenome]
MVLPTINKDRHGQVVGGIVWPEYEVRLARNQHTFAGSQIDLQLHPPATRASLYLIARLALEQ